MEQSKSQQLVEEMIKKYELETTIESRFIDLTSEIGELGKEILKGTEYGKKVFTPTENLESEIGDTIFSLTCIANSLGINMNQALHSAMNKYQKRFQNKSSIDSST